MSFLKKLGQILLKGVQIVTGVGPIVLPFLGSGKAGQVGTAVVNDFTSIGMTVLQIEVALGAVPGSTGAQKLQALIPLVGNIIRTSELVAGKKIADEAKFQQGVTEVAQGVVDILNSIHPDEAK